MSKVWSKKWLKKKYHEELLNSYEIAEIANVSQQTVMRWVDRHGLERVQRFERHKDKQSLYSSKRWIQTAEKVRKRDCYRCQGCGITQSDIATKLDVHHVTPVSKLMNDGKMTDAVFDERNLVSLCRECHISKWEGIPVKPILIE